MQVVKMHEVTGVGFVAVISLSQQPFAVVVPQKDRLGIIFADRPEIGPMSVLSSLRRLGGRATSDAIAEDLRMRVRSVGCHLRKLIQDGLVHMQYRDRKGGRELTWYKLGGGE